MCKELIVGNIQCEPILPKTSPVGVPAPMSSRQSKRTKENPEVGPSPEMRLVVKFLNEKFPGEAPHWFGRSFKGEELAALMEEFLKFLTANKYQR